MSTTIETHVKTVNKAVRAYRKGSQTLFNAIFNAWQELKGPDFKKFKVQVDCDDSTINKTIKIAECEWVMENLDRLPIAWSTLSVIATNYEANGRKLEQALEEGDLNRKSTAKQVRELLDSPKPIKSSGSTISYRPEDFSEEQQARLKEICKELRETFGFKIDASVSSKDSKVAGDATTSKQAKVSGEAITSSEPTKTIYDEVKEEQMKEAA